MSKLAEKIAFDHLWRTQEKTTKEQLAREAKRVESIISEHLEEVEERAFGFFTDASFDYVMREKTIMTTTAGEITILLTQFIKRELL